MAAALLALAGVFTVLGVGTASAITRNTVLARAQTWIDKPVAYSQSRYYGGYRTDCSGFASMSWRTGFSWSTRSFHAVTTSITVDALEPGDALHKVGHIRLFYGWVDAAHTLYVAYEQTGLAARSSIKSIAADLAGGYHPCRYDRIADSAPSRNLLTNPTFDVWARSWSSWRLEPVWWNVDGSDETTVVVRRQDAVHTGREAVELVNPSTSATARSVLSQEVTVTPDTTYAVSAWVRTASDPSGLELCVAYLDTEGRTVARALTEGDAWGVGATAFRQMTATLVAPPEAVRALVSIRLAGGTTAVSATETVGGTSAIIDDLSLARPQAALTIKATTTSTRIGRTVTLSGSVTPAAAVGQPVVVYVQRPGSPWVRWHTHTVTAAGASGAWRCTYTFRRGSRTGTYRFKAEVPAFPGYLGSGRTTMLSVKVR